MFEECIGKWNVLLYVVKNGNISILEFLQIKDINFCYIFESNRNVFYIVCDYGYLSVCEKIIEVCLFLFDIVDYKGRYFGYFVVRSGNVDVLKYFYFQRVDLRKEIMIGMNIFYMVCLYSYSKMCMYILEKYFDMNLKKIVCGWIIMYFVVEKGNSKGSEIKIFEMFLYVICKVNIFVFIDNYNFVLMFVVNINDYKFVEYLFKYYFELLKI